MWCLVYIFIFLSLPVLDFILFLTFSFSIIFITTFHVAGWTSSSSLLNHFSTVFHSVYLPHFFHLYSPRKGHLICPQFPSTQTTQELTSANMFPYGPVEEFPWNMYLLPSPSSPCSPHNRPMNWRQGVEARNTTLFGKLADREDGGLVSPKNHLIRVWMPVSFIAQRRGGDEEVK